MRRFALLALASLLLAPAGSSAQDQARKIVLFIGDGVGASYWTAARFAREDLEVARFRTMGLVDTRSSDSWITDSAAGATAYATGVRTFNGAIGVGPDLRPLRTVLEAARDRGWATGLVATSSVTHATPASFAAHVPSRTQEFAIAADLVEARVDVLLGGGSQWFSASARPDSADLLGRLGQDHVLVTTAEELQALELGAVDRLVGLFAGNQMSSAATRKPSLPDMTRAALTVLDHDAEGFFLMVEGSQPDWMGHGNAPLEAVTAEVLDFDEAIGVALDYQEDHPETLVIVVSDHETGGLAIEVARDSTVLTSTAQGTQSAVVELLKSRPLLDAEGQASVDAAVAALTEAGMMLRLGAATDSAAVRPTARYTTIGHTAQMIPLFAMGPGAERFAGIIDNWRIGELLLQIVGG